ncbi:universal stress protein [Modestobacter sp. NPDC049651]|uniref:universal stress protein n=1 Tax=unclassified Modestobacter TaxID=2643866 RepID=UPI0033FE447C
MSLSPAHPVVVGVDGSPSAEAAARAAATEAARRGRPLRLVRVLRWPDRPLTGLPEGLDARAAVRSSATAALARLATRLTAELGADEVGTAVLDGSPVEVLTDQGRTAELLVLGATGTSSSATGELGSVAEAVATTGPCPVLVHRTAPWGARNRGVVAAVDVVADAGPVLEAAAVEAELRGEPLRVVHAWWQLTDETLRPLEWRWDPAAVQQAERAAVDDLVAALRRRHPELAIDAVVVQGRAPHVVAQEADDASLVVLGQHATPFAEATLHSVLHGVAVPVLTVPLAPA